MDTFAKNLQHHGITERRSHASREELLARTIGTFNEMAGVSLTVPQAHRLCGLDTEQGTRILSELVERGLLVMTPDGLLMRAQDAP